jgi:hypothetical protein
MSLKNVLCTLAVLFATCAPTYAQSGITGTWRAQAIGSLFTWEVFLKTDGSKLTGVVDNCVPSQTEISEGKVVGNTVSFVCIRGDGVSTLTFQGTLKADEILFTWGHEDRNGNLGPRPDHPLFGSAAPRQFTAKRVPDGKLAGLLELGGTKLSGAVNLREKDIRIEGTLFLPDKVTHLRTVIVVVRYGLGFAVEQDPEWLRLSATTESGLIFAQLWNIGPTIDHDNNTMLRPSASDALILLLQRLAQESGHGEVATAPLVLFGQSGAGLFETNFIQQYPRRVAAFVHYHSVQIGDADMKRLIQVPALLIAGGKDTVVRPEVVHDFWQRGRTLGAPWTYAFDPDSPHGDDTPSYSFLKKSDGLMIPWIKAVIRERVSQDGQTLRELNDETAFMANNQTGEIAQSARFSGSKSVASWLPDETSARAWQSLRALGK